jgi:protein-S-isoprenylcysteine O-methyltransferase Ste14
VYVWTASLLLILVCLLWRPIGGDLFDVAGPRAFIHAMVQLSGLALIGLSVRAIDPLELAGIRRRGVDEELHITGPYRLVRHPLYLGWMLIVFGAAHMTGDRLAFAAITALYLVIAIPWEERSLERTFGDAYRRYKGEVRWKAIPYLF